MFRALVFLYFLAGLPQFPATESLPSNSNLLEVNNFQVTPLTSKKPLISAKAILAIDLDSQVPLYKKNTSQALPIASLSKLMTALVILEENNLDDIVTISNEVNAIEGSRIWLYPGEKITVDNLIKGMLIKSGNDSAYELAKFNAGSLENFAQKMNKKAESLGLKDSHFLDPAGLDDLNNYSSVNDLSVISKHILKYSFIRKIVIMKETVISSVDGKISHKLQNTNQLLGSFLGVQGLKTGTTDLARECLISLLKVKDNDILIVILGSEDRYLDTKTLYHHLNSL